MVGSVADEGFHAEGAGDGGVEVDAGVAEDGEVGVGAEGVDGVVGAGGVFRCVGCGGGEVTGHVAAGGEAPDADGVGLEVPLFGVGTDVADGTKAVEERVGIFVARPEAILQDVGGDAVVGKPAGLPCRLPCP